MREAANRANDANCFGGIGAIRGSVNEIMSTETTSYTPVRAPRGATLSCKGWQQEAAMRMLMNNLDEEVAEHPQKLVVYGGSGRAARSWEAFHGIVRALRSLRMTRRCLSNQASRLVSSARLRTPRV